MIPMFFYVYVGLLSALFFFYRHRKTRCIRVGNIKTELLIALCITAIWPVGWYIYLK